MCRYVVWVAWFSKYLLLIYLSTLPKCKCLLSILNILAFLLILSSLRYAGTVFSSCSPPDQLSVGPLHSYCSFGIFLHHHPRNSRCFSHALVSLCVSLCLSLSLSFFWFIPLFWVYPFFWTCLVLISWESTQGDQVCGIFRNTVCLYSTLALYFQFGCCKNIG